MKQKDVGILKSAYWFAAQRIKSNVRSGEWVKNIQGSGNAIAETRNPGDVKPEVTVGNAKGRKGTENSLIRSAINSRAFAMRNAMARELNKQKVPLWLATAQGQTSGTYKLFK